MASGAQDFHITVPAGGTRNISRQGEFVYLKAADRAVDVIMPNQTRVTMEAGDKLKQDVFNGFQVQNPDPLNPAELVFTVGMGDYWRQIVQGEISVVPGLRGADGTWRPDTRHTLALNLYPKTSNAESFAAGATLGTSAVTGWNYTTEGENGQLVTAHQLVDRISTVYVMDTTTLKLVRSFNTAYNPNNTSTYGADIVWSPIHGYLLITRAGIFDLVTANLKKPLQGTNQYGTACRIYPKGQPQQAGRIVISYGNGGSQYVIDEKSLEIIDQPTNLTFSNASRMRFDSEKQIIIVNNTGTQLYYDTQLKQLPDQGLPGMNQGGEGGFYPMGRYAFTSKGGYWDTPVPIKKIVETAFDVPGQAIATPKASGMCAAIQALTRDSSAKLYTTANVNFNYSNGITTISGEVIRFALENYFKAEVPNGYLDHVYEVIFSQPANGALADPISGGVNSLDRQNVDDNFTIYLPTSVQIVVDSGLSLGDGSQVN